MKKTNKSVFVCQECGYESVKWQGKCICGAWNSFVEEKVQISSGSKKKVVKASQVKSLSDLSHSKKDRKDTGFSELNRVLGGGIVPGSLTLITGDPGIGKSTLLLQVAENIAKSGEPVLYVSGEESSEQIYLRAKRICKEIPKDILILQETNVEAILASIAEVKPSLVIIDSIQTMASEEFTSPAGSVSQVRASSDMIADIAKKNNIPVFIVAHVTKEGQLAGPKVVEHLVDTVLFFNGDRVNSWRFLRSLKNRFGSTTEVGAFNMEESGLVELSDLSGNFLKGFEDGVEGSCVTAIYEGSRPVFLEIQALISKCNAGFARRSVVGIESSRLNMILAVLERRLKMSFLDLDVYVSVVGGMKVDSPSIDLAIASALYSVYRKQPGNKKTIVLGEISLTGTLRPVLDVSRISKEAKKLGFHQVICPNSNSGQVEGLEVSSVKEVRSALEEFIKR